MRLMFRAPPWLLALASRYMPFADAVSHDLPLGRLLRLSLFQAAIGITLALLVGTLNRGMIVELGVPAWWVALSVALPLVFAPLRTLIGYRSDTHPSALGLRRLPYLWVGTLLMFGGLAIMPFALLALAEPREGYLWTGRIGAALAFLLVGAGIQMTQTSGLALASDIAQEDKRPRVVALLYAMQLMGMVVGSACLGWLLHDFTPLRMIQVVQTSAVVVVFLCLFSFWKQEARGARRGRREPDGFAKNWGRLMAIPKMRRFLWTVGLGTSAFSMQDVLLEPFGGEILKLDVGLTSSLTALSAGGSLIAFLLSARLLSKGLDACRLAAVGALLGLPAFACVIFGAPRLQLVVPFWQRADWLCRWPVLRGHVDHGDGNARQRNDRHGAGRLGRGASHGSRCVHGLGGCFARRRHLAGQHRLVGRAPEFTGHRLQLCVPFGNLFLVCGSDCARSFGPTPSEQAFSNAANGSG